MRERFLGKRQLSSLFRWDDASVCWSHCKIMSERANLGNNNGKSWFFFFLEWSMNTKFCFWILWPSVTKFLLHPFLRMFQFKIISQKGKICSRSKKWIYSKASKATYLRQKWNHCRISASRNGPCDIAEHWTELLTLRYAEDWCVMTCKVIG